MEGLLFLIGITLLVGLPVGAFMGFMAWLRVGQLTEQIKKLEVEVERLRQRPAVPPRLFDHASPVAPPPALATSARPPVATAVSPSVSASVPLTSAPNPIGIASTTAPKAVPLPVPVVTSRTDAPITAVQPLAIPLAEQQPGTESPAPELADAGVPLADTGAVIAVTAVPSTAAADKAIRPASTSTSNTPVRVDADKAPPTSSPVAAAAPTKAATKTKAAATGGIWLSEVEPPSSTPRPPQSPQSPTSPGNSPAPRASTSSAPKDFEAIIGKRWLTWSGVALVFLSGVFLLKYAYDQDWLGHYVTPPMRIAGMALAAVAMLVVGLRLLRQGMTALGHGLAGGGIALAYLTVYGGFSPRIMLVPEPLFPGHLAFVLMALITAGGMTLAVRANALAMAVCAVLGGFATPVLIDTGGGSREALFTYVLLLDLGVLGAAWFRRWRALDVLAFVGTVVLYAGWQHSREAVGTAPWGMLSWLAVFHLVFLLLPFAYHWRTRTAVTIERFALAVGNLAFALAYAAVLLRGDHHMALAVVCLVLAGLYAAIGVFTRNRIPDDQKVVHGFLALGTMLLTLGLFYLLPVEAVATAWAAEAVALLALGYRYQHQPTRLIAQVVLACAVLRLLVTRLPPHDLDADFIFNGWLLSWLVMPLGLAGMATVHRWFGVSEHDRRWQIGSWWLAGATMLLVGSGEIIRRAAGHPRAWVLLPQASLHGLWWMLGGMGFLAGAWRWRAPVTARLALLPVLLAVVFALSAYAASWSGGAPVFNPRCLLALSTLVGLVVWLRVVARGVERLGDTVTMQPVLMVLAQLGTVLLATLETMAWFARPLAESTPTSSLDQHLTLTLVWAVLALVSVLLAAAWRLRLLAQVSVLPLLAALLAGFLLYVRHGEPVTLVANARFLVLILAVVVVGCQRLVFTHTAWIPSLVQALATAALTCELVRWSSDHFAADLAAAYGTWAVALTWAGSSVIASRRWQRGASLDAWWLAVAIGLMAALPALAGYWLEWRTALPFLNLRALAPALVVAALVVAWKAYGRRPPPGELQRTTLAWSAVVVAFIACTCDAPVHFLQAIADPALASRVATFSVTVVWVVLAALALTTGFYWRLRVVRYLALGLFALTAGKLVLIDMSGVQQLYRIIAFMLVGVTLIGASYAYHRLEQRFLPSTKPAEPPADT